MAVRPIHHWGDGEAAGELGGCGGDRGHWQFWVGPRGPNSIRIG
jgi:hypothetical protein